MLLYPGANIVRSHACLLLNKLKYFEVYFGVWSTHRQQKVYI